MVPWVNYCDNIVVIYPLNMDLINIGTHATYDYTAKIFINLFMDFYKFQIPQSVKT